MKESMKQIIASVMSSVLVTFFLAIGILSKENAMVKTDMNIIKSEIAILRDSRDNLSNYYVTRREFNSIVEAQNKLMSELKSDQNKLISELKSDMNKRMDKMEDLILRK